MRHGRVIMAKWRENARLRLLGWATLFALACGTLGLLEPVEDWLQMVRGQIAPHAASGKIVVVGIDEKSFSKVGRWPWPRAVTAKLIDKLNEAGVKGIYFDFVFLGSTSADDQRAFQESIRRSKAPVILAAAAEVNSSTAKRTGRMVLPSVQFAKIASVTARTNYAGQIRRYQFGERDDHRIIPSMSSTLAGLSNGRTDSYPLDTAIQPGTIPTISAQEVILSATPINGLRGKRVIIGPAAAFLGDIKQYPGLGPLPGVYFHVIGAETLMRGIPVELGWIPGVVIAFLAAFLALRKQAKHGLVLLIGAVLLLFSSALVFEQQLVFVQVAPAFVLVSVISVRLLFSRARRLGGLVNSGTGIPNLEALRDRDRAAGDMLIAMRIHNYADIVSSLHANVQIDFVNQVIGRLALGSSGGTIYQGDNGDFTWLKPRIASGVIGDELEGLYAIMRQPIRVGERGIDLLTTFGVERDGSRSLTNRIGSALLAADEARTSGEHWRDFDPGSLESAEWRLSMLGQIDGAIENGEIWVAFQPQLDLATGRIDGAEALLRWTHPVRGAINPEEFVLHAEMTGRIDHLTRFVVETAARAGVTMLAHGLDFHISVNLSAGLLDNPYMADIIGPQVDATGFPRERMTLEITESSEIKKDAQRTALIHKLVAARFQLSIDDYGTGYSTLDYMKRIPAAEIKIDKSFVAQIATSQADRVMVSSTIDLAHQLDRRVVAEGVEDEATLELLRSMKCDVAQGYLIGHPKRFADLEALVLAKQPRRSAA
jgi:diguanylate cyclase